jgi:hypothetical protein
VGVVVKPVGKPDAGNPHVGFAERGRETTGWYQVIYVGDALHGIVHSTRYTGSFHITPQ